MTLHIWHISVLVLSLPLSIHGPAHLFKISSAMLHTTDTRSYFHDRTLREGRAEQSTTSTLSQEHKVWDPGQPPDLITCRNWSIRNYHLYTLALLLSYLSWNYVSQKAGKWHLVVQIHCLVPKDLRRQWNAVCLWTALITNSSKNLFCKAFGFKPQRCWQLHLACFWQEHLQISYLQEWYPNERHCHALMSDSTVCVVRLTEQDAINMCSFKTWSFLEAFIVCTDTDKLTTSYHQVPAEFNSVTMTNCHEVAL